MRKKKEKKAKWVKVCVKVTRKDTGGVVKIEYLYDNAKKDIVFWESAGEFCKIKGCRELLMIPYENIGIMRLKMEYASEEEERKAREASGLLAVPKEKT